MIRFRSRLLFALITLITLVFLALGLLLAQLFKNYYVESFHQKIQMETKLITQLLSAEYQTDNLYLLFDKVGEETDSRIMVYSSKGELWFDSEREFVALKRHSTIIEDILNESTYSKTGTKEMTGGYDVYYYWERISLSAGQDAVVILNTQIDEIKRFNNHMWWILFISFGISLTVMILLGSRITTRYTKPIEAATITAIELAKGNYHARTYEDRHDETGLLSTSINILARNLQETIESNQIQQERLSTLIENMGSGLVLIDEKGYTTLVNKVFRQWFDIDPSQFLYKHYYEVMTSKEIHKLVEEVFMIEQPVRREVQIQDGLEKKHYDVLGAPIMGNAHEWKGTVIVFHDITELKKLEQMRKDFVANVSHELKTPITSITGFTETLLDGAMNDQEALENFLRIIHIESERLQSLVKDLLDLSKIEQHGFTLDIQEFEFNELIDEVIAILKPKAMTREIELHTDIQFDQLRIKGDPLRIKQIIINLVNNALSYTPKNGFVSIRAYEEKQWLVIQVADSGIGIEKHEIPRIFERFYRVDKARSRNSGGTGLGLAIVKHLVEAHKGKIKVESQVGKGTTFSIYLLK